MRRTDPPSTMRRRGGDDGGSRTLEHMAMSDLETFAARYGIDPAYLTNPVNDHVPFRIDGAGHDFNGTVQALRILPYGRFGNTLFSVLNALVIGRTLNIRAIELPTLSVDYTGLPATVDDLEFSADDGRTAERPTLIGNFFVPTGFEPVSEHCEPESVQALTEKYLRGVYSGLLDEAGSLGSNVVALNFRAGDIFFPGGTQTDYVQPPASYYVKCVEHACRHLGVNSAYLVFEDRSNPTVDIVQNELTKLGIPITLQSATISQDLVTILSAHHLVAPYGTFCEAAAVLSPVLQSYSSFRTIGTQTNIRHWTQARIGEILRARGVRTFVVDDPDGSYIAPGTWHRSNEQLDLMRAFPKEKLRHMEKFTRR